MIRESCKTCKNNLCAKTVPLFSHLSKSELNQIVSKTASKSYEKGDILSYEGEEANKLYIINEGKVKLYKHTQDGKEQILHILSTGDFFGELNLFKKSLYTFYAKALSDVKLCVLTHEHMQSILLSIPHISLKILEQMSQKLSKLENLAQSLATNNVEVRLANLLLELKESFGHPTPLGTEIHLPLTREEMSHYTGVARETISRKLKKFQEKQIIQLIGNKKILLLQEEKLRAFL